ncbi:hypothetical protein, partial [Cupriavidus sp. SS-3]|uniref:hypothetical protein n=1 Tax=Cupriavidus sp. SS-3 TaxID=3109596 RepID=UPI002DBA1A3C
ACLPIGNGKMRTKRNLPHTESRPLPYGRHHACRAIGLAVLVLACSAVLVDTDNGRDAFQRFHLGEDAAPSIR